MVVPQKSENQVYADIVRSLKQNLRTEIQPPSVAHGGERKVRIRTGCYYKSQFSDDHWRDKYDRHVKQSVGGFYTPAHVLYASIGDVCLDIRDLVLKTVGCDQESEKSKNLDAIADLSEQEKRTDDEGDTAAQKKPHKLDKRACFAFEDQGGLSEIKGKLLQYRSRLSALRAGQSLDECLGKEDIMFMVVEAMREDEKPKISSAILKQWLKKARPSERFDAIPLLGDELIPAFPSEVNKSEHEEEAIDQRDVRERYIRNFTSKLSCLYTLLCSIYHLRTRDLRTKTPLSRDFLKALRTKVQTDQKGRPLRPTRNTTHTHTLSRGAHQRSSTDVTISRMEHESHLSPLMNTRASFVSDSPSSLFRPGITSTGAIESRQSFSRKLRLRDTSDKIETWEDLIEAGEKPPSNPQAPFPGMVRGGAGNEPGARGGITRTSFLQTAKMPYGMRQRRYGILQALGNQAQTSVACENMPLWHQVALSEKNSKENGNSSAFQKRRAKKSSSKIESSLSDMITEGFANIQAKSAEWVKDELNRINRKERESFIKKFLAFNPCSLFKVDLQRVQQAGRGVSEAYSRQHVKTATWYGELEQEAQEFGVRREINVVTCLKKLYPFAIDGVTTVPFVQAKLCLVVQSLPAYELCSLTMMDALKFLLKKILNSSSGTFNEWMNHRKLLNVDKPSSS